MQNLAHLAVTPGPVTTPFRFNQYIDISEIDPCDYNLTIMDHAFARRLAPAGNHLFPGIMREITQPLIIFIHINEIYGPAFFDDLIHSGPAKLTYGLAVHNNVDQFLTIFRAIADRISLLLHLMHDPGNTLQCVKPCPPGNRCLNTCARVLMEKECDSSFVIREPA